MSAVLSNAPFLLNLDYDNYINNSKTIREAMCFMMDQLLGKRVCYVQFSQRFDGIVDTNDQYDNQTTALPFIDVTTLFSHSQNKNFSSRLGKSIIISRMSLLLSRLT